MAGRCVHALWERKLAGVELRILVCTRELRKKALQAQFAEAAKNWAAWSIRPENQHALAAFAGHFNYAHSSFADFDTWINFSMDKQDEILGKLFAVDCIEYTDDFVPLITWIVDGRTEAFFAVANQNGKTSGFVSHDGNLIEAFSSVRERYRRVAARPVIVRSA